MAENIVISFVSDTDQLQSAVPALEKITAADANLNAEVKKTTASFTDRQRALDQQNKSSATAKLTLDQLSNSVKELNKNVIGNASTKQVEQFATQMGQATGKATTLVTQLRALRQELTVMEQAGLAGSRAFTDLAVKAGKLQNALGDASQRIRILASDTKNLDAALSVATGLAGSMAVVQGASALWGDENKELQESLLKVQASLAILNGLQAVSATLNKDSAASVVLLSAAQRAYTVVVGTTTGALRLLRIALAATGIGLLIIGIVALIENFDKLKNLITGGVNPELRNLAKEKQKIVDISEKAVESFDLEERRLKAIGVTDTEITKQRIANIVAVLNALELQQAVEQDILDEQVKAFGKQAGIVASLKGSGAIGAGAGGLLELLGFGSVAEVAEQSAKLTDISKKIREAQVAILEGQKEIFDATKDQKTPGSIGFLTERTSALTKELENLVPGTEKYRLKLLELKDAILELSLAEAKAKFVRSGGIGDLEKLEQQQIEIPPVEEDPEAQHAVKLKEFKVRTFQETMDAIQEINDKETKERLQKDLEYAQAFAAIINQLLEFNVDATRNELDALRDKNQKGLISEKEYAKQVAQIERKQAVAEKQKAAFNIALATAEAIIRAFPNGVLMAAAGVLGAVQLAAVASRPLPEIPQFAKGTKKAPPGAKWVGEKGPELVVDPGGYAVLPHEQSMKFAEAFNMIDSPSIIPDLPYISDASMNNMERYRSNGSGINYDLLADKLSERIARHPRLSVNIDEHGFEKRIIEGANRRKSLDDYYKWTG